MPLAEYQPDLIQLRVADRFSPAGVRYAQVARFVGLTHTQAPSGAVTVVFVVTVEPYALTDTDEVGEKLALPFYDVPLRADNDTLVAMETGQLVAARQAGELPGDWLARCAAFEENVMLQADYFCYLRDHQPLLIGSLVRAHIAEADRLGKFAAV